MSELNVVCGHTKYEGCPPCLCERAVLDAFFEGRLVDRTTIDYEAAMVTFQVVASGAIGLGLEPAVRAIVDAALGIGGDDE